MQIETVIVDTCNAPEKWYTVTTHEHDGKISTVSRQTFATALEYAIRECDSIENDAYRFEHDSDCIFKDEFFHSFPVVITVTGDYHNVLFQLTESEA